MQTQAKKANENSVSKDRIYKQTGNSAPLSYILPSRSTNILQLLHFDESKGARGENRELRYAPNQKSPFVDEQDSNIILEPVIFENGYLTVPRTNPVLQEFLSLHPFYGISFVEFDESKEADLELAKIDLQEEAILAARQLTGDQIESLVRVVLRRDPNTMESSIMVRDIKRYARDNPKEFLAQIGNTELTHDANVRMFFDKGMLGLRNNNEFVHFNLPDNKSRMLVVPKGVDPYIAVGNYLMSDAGIETLKMLERVAETM